jgi:hypothetical protein
VGELATYVPAPHVVAGEAPASPEVSDASPEVYDVPPEVYDASSGMSLALALASEVATLGPPSDSDDIASAAASNVDTLKGEAASGSGSGSLSELGSSAVESHVLHRGELDRPLRSSSETQPSANPEANSTLIALQNVPPRHVA